MRPDPTNPGTWIWLLGMALGLGTLASAALLGLGAWYVRNHPMGDRRR